MPNLQRFRSSSALAIVVTFTSTPYTALAEDSSTLATQESFHDRPFLEEIIVTATRREASVQSVPLSVSVLTGEDIERLGATGFADYARTVPGVSFVDQGWGGEKHVIRGISSSATMPEINPTTTLYLDEVPVIPLPRRSDAGGYRANRSFARPTRYFVRCQRDGWRHSHHYRPA